ncbi:YlbE-like family protein [Gracilibacillus sp. S3-1-1]|uniref:YlbE-like family protein n=1 Tax=Gracilibacillus pellucidus TaxID=3095368 RepID=A0ACC6M1S4_9BACI|nr:YlbE-like family protein [Gracilibacillus sp. S3-1-1]MDX8044908.1 YlbE-like family protein [Gracilibacillus sp. S3-1-1]
MEPETYRFIQERRDLWQFIRLNPEWYRHLTRYPEDLTDLEAEAKQFYGRTWSQRLEKTGQNIQMARMLMQMAGSWNE